MKVTEGIFLQSLTWWLPPQYKSQNISLVVTLNTFDLKLLYSNTNESKHDRKQQEPMLNILKYKKKFLYTKTVFLLQSKYEAQISRQGRVTTESLLSELQI